MKKVLAALVSCLLRAAATPEVGSAPVIFRTSVDIDGGKWVANVVIREGQEPADVIFDALRPYGVDRGARRAVLAAAAEVGVPRTRDLARVFSRDVVLENGTFAGTFVLDDDGREPVDALYDFSKERGIASRFRGLSDALLSELCALVPCARRRPRIWRNPITSDDGRALGTLEVLEGDEPIDVVDAFVRKLPADIGDGTAFRGNLWRVVCETVTCSRTIPVVFRKTIKDADGRDGGAIEILENEEVIDGVVRFLRKSKLQIDDETALKNYMFQQACGLGRVKCTRNVALVYEQRITSSEGALIGTLAVYENEEPADKVYLWIQEHGLGLDAMEGILDAVCASAMAVCRRREPVYYSIPISGPEGDVVGTLELKVGNEPVDDIYAFFASHGLFKKEWDFHGVAKQICAKPDVDCRRLKAVKYFHQNFTMGGHSIGQLVVWEDEEIVDVLYDLRQRHNLTSEDQEIKFNEICRVPEVVCARTRAVVFRKADITKLDYVKFGNETCKRQFVGFKFRSSFVSLPFGGKLAEWLKEDAVAATLAHPGFGPCLLLCLLGILLLVVRLPRVRARVHPAQTAVAALGLVFLTAVLQAALVEPDTAVDIAMHTYEGKLPDLVVLEEEEPVDALLKWGKLAAKDHHPIVREPIYWEILDELCNHTESLNCTRTRAWEFNNMGHMTYSGQEYPIDYYNPAVDPIAGRECRAVLGGNATSCQEEAATRFCARLRPPPAGCARDITLHIASQLDTIDAKRLDAKCSYQRLRLEMDAPGRELYKRAAGLARARRVNMSPFHRVDNGTVPYTWDEDYLAAGTVVDTFKKIHDPEAREWNDKPCTPYFGGALCAKTDKDGNMIIEV